MGFLVHCPPRAPPPCLISCSGATLALSFLGLHLTLQSLQEDERSHISTWKDHPEKLGQCPYSAPQVEGTGHSGKKDGVASLPAPQNLSVNSTNMKHLLTWSPVILAGETVHCSVEYQGEYESLYISWIWIPTSWCTVIEEPKCDVTDDITATVPYKLRVRATLGSQTSAWSTLKHPFNQNSTILTPPRMEVSKDGFHLVIELEDLGPQFEFLVAYWRREPGAKEQTKVGRSRGVPVHLETMDPGATYCVKAQSLVKVIGRHSAFNQAECVEVQGKEDLPVPWAPAEVTAPLGACSGNAQSGTMSPTLKAQALTPRTREGTVLGERVFVEMRLRPAFRVILGPCSAFCMEAQLPFNPTYLDHSSQELSC
ncbi:interleukin-20 receptor subunit beta-like [Ictidomys tridecemlineatus]